MSFESIKKVVEQQAENISPLGATFKFVLDDHPIYVDGTGEKNIVTEEDKDAECVIITSAETLSKMKNGELNPMMAVMSGQVKIKGDMSLAMKLQSLIG